MSDTKHGWVSPRADGLRARCGGPGLCTTCNTEREHEAMHTAAPRAPLEPEMPHTQQDGLVVGKVTDHRFERAADAGWLPIESAPKDGRRVLLWNERYNAAITGQFYGLGGWKLDGEMPPLFHQPTHWMPLPAAPGAPASPVSTVEQGEAQKPNCRGADAVIDDYIDEYELRGENDEGRDGVYSPTESERYMIKDAIYGLLAEPEFIAALFRAPAAGDARDAALWRAYATEFPEVSAAFLAMHGWDVLPTIKGASITGGYVIVTPAGWGSDKATKVRDAILRLFPVNPAHTPQPSAAQQAEQGAGR